MITIMRKVSTFNPERKIINEAAKIITSGGLVAFPTETVYGLGADALNPDAVRKIYAAKGRPSDNPLILHVHSPEHAAQLVHMNAQAERLAKIFWPAPLTLVLPAKPHIPLITRGGLDTAAVRMPDNPTALALIEASHTPIAAPSANISGRPSPTDAQSVFADMDGRIDFILDGGSVDIGIESTVIDLTNHEKPLMLRPGGMSREIIEHELGLTLTVPDTNSAKRSPGTRYRHYAPSIPVRIWHEESDIDTHTAGYMGVHDTHKNFGDVVLFDDFANYARGLFAGFRKFEREGVSCIFVEWPESNSGICEGLRDRIKRAAGCYV